VNVRFFRNPMMLFLAAFWLLVTQHCGLEAAGAWPDVGHAANCCANGQDCSTDGCKVVEEGAYKVSGNLVKVPAPDLLTCLALIYACAPPATALQESSPCPAELIQRPLDWLPTWQFERRAALSPRAPSRILS